MDLPWVIFNRTVKVHMSYEKKTLLLSIVLFGL